MKVGDLVKLINITGGVYAKLRGIILKIDEEGFHEILWSDGDITQEFNRDLEVVCK